MGFSMGASWMRLGQGERDGVAQGLADVLDRPLSSRSSLARSLSTVGEAD